MAVTKNQLPNVQVSEFEHSADSLDLENVARDYNEYGAFVVRRLMSQYVDRIRDDINAITDEAIAMLHLAETVPGEGWTVPNGTLFLPAPPDYVRDKQVMVVSCNYTTSAAFFRSALDDVLLSIIKAILGPDVEIFLNGQCLVKEPVGGHPKELHQDAAYFEHKYEGPLAAFCYGVDTNLNNGALYVVPGSHRLGVLEHTDTFSHLGFDETDWSWTDAVPIIGGAGDVIFFHVNTIHGSQENHSDSRRPAFIHRYRRADDYVVISAGTTKERKEAKEAIAQARKQNQLGLLVSGRRVYSPDR